MDMSRDQSAIEPSLSDTAKQRIQLEEQLRLEIRSKLEAEYQNHAHQKRGLVSFLSSKLGLLILGSLIFPTLGGLYTHLRASENERITTNKQIVALLAEFDWRVARIAFYADHPLRGSEQSSRGYIYQVIVGGPNYHPTLPEFNGVHLGGVVTRLRVLAEPIGSDSAMSTINEMETELTAPVPSEVIRRQLKVLQAPRSRVMLRTGFWSFL